jgi:phospholipid/cholesterol/gamma-HCH transport system ATP-binding protein
MNSLEQEKEPLIELRGVSKYFGDRCIFDKINLTLYRGEALVIIGPSGTGKSTILKLISGLESIDEGEIYIKGKLRSGLIEDASDPINIALVFQQSALFDSLTVGENVGFSLLEHSNLPLDRIKEIVVEKLRMVGLGDISDRYPAELSGGMRKRVSFARAIIADPAISQDTPDVILYDEPTAGLDPIASTLIEDLVRNLQKKSIVPGTYVMVSHQHSTIKRTADRVILLYNSIIQWDGRVEEIDTTDNLMVRQFFSGKIEGPIHSIDL